MVCGVGATLELLEAELELLESELMLDSELELELELGLELELEEVELELDLLSSPPHPVSTAVSARHNKSGGICFIGFSPAGMWPRVYG